MKDNETLLGVSAVYLFGRKLTDLILQPNYQAQEVPKTGRNNFLREQLELNSEEQPAGLARIFAFSFEGAFYELARPTIFLVHGFGLNPDDPAPTNVKGEVEYDRLT